MIHRSFIIFFSGAVRESIYGRICAKIDRPFADSAWAIVSNQRPCGPPPRQNPRNPFYTDDQVDSEKKNLRTDTTDLNKAGDGQTATCCI